MLSHSTTAMNTWILALFAFLALTILTNPTLAQTPTAVTDMAGPTPMSMATPAPAASTPASDPINDSPMEMPTADSEMDAEPNANLRMGMGVAQLVPATPMTPADVDNGVGASQYYPACYWYYAGPYYYCYYNMWGPYYYCYVSDIGCCCQPIYY
ncbi:hypothetical protein HK102_012606 [Quaeritorhiza haematococci]|nr:hypothetical protein HK102_012606 [Quaeritorhiza haematococci]